MAQTIISFPIGSCARKIGEFVIPVSYMDYYWIDIKEEVECETFEMVLVFFPSPLDILLRDSFFALSVSLLSRKRNRVVSNYGVILEDEHSRPY